MTLKIFLKKIIRKLFKLIFRKNLFSSPIGENSPYYINAKNNNLLELSTRAYKLIFRMCESYELWCKETNESQLIQLAVLD